MAKDALSAEHVDADAIQCEAIALELNGQLVVRLPPDASAALPSRGQVAVTGRMNGHHFETVVEPDGMRGHWIKLDDRTPAEIAAGDDVTLEMTVAGVWPEPVVPEDLEAALGDAPDLAGLWESITPMARWEWVRWINATRSHATRARRVEVGISKMRSGKRRPCCFDLAACTDPELSRSGKLIEAGADA